jgi:hypothetical protein
MNVMVDVLVVGTRENVSTAVSFKVPISDDAFRGSRVARLSAPRTRNEHLLFPGEDEG